MLAVGFTALSVALATLIGLALFRWKAGRLLWLKILAAICVSVFALVASGAGYLFLLFSFPSNDSEVLRDTHEYAVKIFREAPPKVSEVHSGVYYGLGGWEEARAGVQPKKPRRFPLRGAGTYVEGSSDVVCRIALQIPKYTRAGSDFTIGYAVQAPIGSRVKASLVASQDWEIRSPDGCEKSNPSDLCLTSKAGVSNGQWIVRPKSAAASKWTVVSDFDIESVCGKDWFAEVWDGDTILSQHKLNVGGEGVFRKMTPQGPNVGADGFSPGYVVYVDNKNLIARNQDGFIADLGRMQISGDIDVVRTLGVNESTFQWLAIIGAISSSALGSGWLISALAPLLRALARLLPQRIARE
jgi:hypothetical protein